MDNTSVKTLTDREECADAVELLINAAQLKVSIFSQQLEPLLYNHPHICEALSTLARKNRHSQIRILAQHTQPVSSSGHCLITLAQKLSTFVQIHVPTTPELQRFSESWLIVDDHSICQINNPDRYEGSLVQNDRIHVKSKLDFFEHAWENSQPDQQSRRLHI